MDKNPVATRSKVANSREYWEAYYSRHQEPAKSSNFAHFVTPFLKENTILTEFGCGNGRDTLHFAKMGVKVQAIDQCGKEIEYLNGRYGSFKNITFLQGDMTNLQPLGKSDYLYSRFTIHSIDSQGEANLLNWAKNNIRKYGLFFIEVRSIADDLFGVGQDLGDNAYFSDHYRRFIVRHELESALEALGFRILYSKEGRGMAPHKEEDPVVIRLICQKV